MVVETKFARFTNLEYVEPVAKYRETSNFQSDAKMCFVKNAKEVQYEHGEKNVVPTRYAKGSLIDRLRLSMEILWCEVFHAENFLEYHGSEYYQCSKCKIRYTVPWSRTQSSSIAFPSDFYKRLRSIW